MKKVLKFVGFVLLGLSLPCWYMFAIGNKLAQVNLPAPRYSERVNLERDVQRLGYTAAGMCGIGLMCLMLGCGSRRTVLARFDDRDAMAKAPIPLTKESFKKLQMKLDHLQSHEMVEETRRMAEARAKGELSQDVEDRALAELRFRVNLLKQKLSRANVVDGAKLPADTVVYVYGVRVKLKDLDTNDELHFAPIGPGNEDYNSYESYCGKRVMTDALLGRKIGDVAKIQSLAGTVRFQIIEISFER